MDGWIPIILIVEPPIAPQATTYLIKGYKNGYLATHVPRMMDYLRALIPDAEGPFVFTSRGTELPFHWPTGVLYDVYRPEIPWKIHLQPGSPALDPKNIHSFWQQQIKESCYIRDGNSNAIMKMSRQTSMDLWQAVATTDLDKYNAIMRPLISSIKSIPLKMYHEKNLIYKLADVEKTLGAILHEYLPEVFASTRIALTQRPYLMGAEVPLQAPIRELYKYCYVDGFLHLSIY